MTRQELLQRITNKENFTEKYFVRDYDELWRSEKENVFIFYSQFDLGAKYKIYRKVDYGVRIGLEYVNSFTSYCEAFTYAKNIHDILIER